MATFKQQGQRVAGNQYNADTISFGTAESKADYTVALHNIKNELTQAGDAQVIDAEVISNAEYEIGQALQQVQKPEPDKSQVVSHLDQAKAIIGGVTAASGMVTALTQAIEMAHKLFT